MYIINILKNPEILFYLITTLMFICSLLVIISKNPVHSLLFLVLIFLFTTILFLTINVDFLAMLFLVLYVGAIVVLFLFVVMMLNVRILELRERIISYIPIAIIIMGVFLILILFILKLTFITPTSNTPDSIDLANTSFYQNFVDLFTHKDFNKFISETYTNFLILGDHANLAILGAVLYQDYAYLFLLAGIVLLVAMLGAIVLTHNQIKKSKRQDYYSQTNKDITKAIRHLK